MVAGPGARSESVHIAGAVAEADTGVGVGVGPGARLESVDIAGAVAEADTGVGVGVGVPARKGAAAHQDLVMETV